MYQIYVEHRPIFEPHEQSKYFYKRMRAHGRLRKIRAMFSPHPRRLLALDDIKATYAITNRYEVGSQNIPIRQIRGSENKSADFDAGFCPLSERTTARWLRVAEAWLEGVWLPPIELIQVGDCYFVRDGHHRLSVACALGRTHIEANVTVWKVEPLAREVLINPAQ